MSSVNVSPADALLGRDFSSIANWHGERIRIRTKERLWHSRAEAGAAPLSIFAEAVPLTKNTPCSRDADQEQPSQPTMTKNACRGAQCQQNINAARFSPTENSWCNTVTRHSGAPLLNSLTTDRLADRCGVAGAKL